MVKTSKLAESSAMLVPAVEEVPRISDAERRMLQTSLADAEAEIAAGNYDTLTPGILRAEFDAIDDEGIADVDQKLGKRASRRSSRN